jgi:hypothetical protein
MTNESTHATSDTSRNSAPTIASINDIDRDLSHRAFNNTSFSPEKRGDARREEYANTVNGLYAELWPRAKTDEQKQILADEMERYRQGYIKHLTAYLHSHSAVASSMITGPARFPTARNQKRSQWADNKMNELIAWENKARAAIKAKLLDARPQEVKDAQEWELLRRDIAGSLSTIAEIDEGKGYYTRAAFVNSIAGKIERLAGNGEVELVTKALAFLEAYNAEHKKPCMTKQHKVWAYGELSKKVEQLKTSRADKPPSKLGGASGVELWANYELDRLQLRFDDKPDYAMREKLKRSGWKWAPSQEAWQRQLTSNAIESGKAILAGLMPQREATGEVEL